MLITLLGKIGFSPGERGKMNFASRQRIGEPLPVQPAGVIHVDEERRALLHPVEPQGPCLLIEAHGPITLKIIK
jgi:hypothetical protein